MFYGSLNTFQQHGEKVLVAKEHLVWYCEHVLWSEEQRTCFRVHRYDVWSAKHVIWFIRYAAWNTEHVS